MRNQRPNSDRILIEKHLWSYNFDDISNEIKYNIDFSQEYKTDKDFVKRFLQIKYKLQKTETKYSEPKPKSIKLQDSNLHENLNKEYEHIPIAHSFNNLQIKDSTTPKPSLMNKFKNFSNISIINRGDSIMYKVQDPVNGKIKAIKRINVNFDIYPNIINEMQMLLELTNNHLIRYEDIWLEENDISDITQNENPHVTFHPKNMFLYIKMEFSLTTLENLIKEFHGKPPSFSRKMTQIEFYIACELIIELIEGIDFLHRQKTPIIHGNIKLSNILITEGLDGYFVKISDINFKSNKPYLNEMSAPELNSVYKINTKTDIYSIGMIIKKLFNIDNKG